jgi:hypothetical protein
VLSDEDPEVGSPMWARNYARTYWQHGEEPETQAALTVLAQAIEQAEARVTRWENSIHDYENQAHAAHAAERALVERIEAGVLPDLKQVAAMLARYAQDECECDHFTNGRAVQLVATIDRLRAALRPEAATMEGAAPICEHCEKPVRRRGSTWEHYSPTWQGRRCPNRITGATPLPAAPSTDREDE